MPEDKAIDFYYADISTELRAAITWVRTERINPTTLNTSYTSPENPTIDVVMIDRYYTDWCENELGVQWTTNGVTGLLGFAACYRTVASGRCNQQMVRISNHFLDAHDAYGDRWITCHEVGHALGLVHRGTVGCMSQPPAKNPNYTTHDLGHLNSSW